MSALTTVGIMVLSAFLAGFNFPLVKSLIVTIPPMEAVSARFIIAALTLVVIAYVKGHAIPLIKHGKNLGLLGLIGVVGFNVLFFLALEQTSAINASLIMGTNPLVTALLASVVLGERPSQRHLIAMPVAFLGVAVVVLGKGGALSLSMGDGMMMAANVSWAMYNILAKRWIPQGSPIANLAVIMIYSSVFLSVIALSTGTVMVLPSMMSGLKIVFIGTAGTVLMYLCFNYGIAKLGASKAALYNNLVPVWAMVTSVVMGVEPTLLQGIGGAMVIVSVVYATMPKKETVIA